jgi:hypothetical protein
MLLLLSPLVPSSLVRRFHPPTKSNLHAASRVEAVEQPTKEALKQENKPGLTEKGMKVLLHLAVVNPRPCVHLLNHEKVAEKRSKIRTIRGPDPVRPACLTYFKTNKDTIKRRLKMKLLLC